jgi:hypothetical protein
LDHETGLNSTEYDKMNGNFACACDGLSARDAPAAGDTD